MTKAPEESPQSNVTASGERSVAIGGDVQGSTIITGDIIQNITTPVRRLPTDDATRVQNLTADYLEAAAREWGTLRAGEAEIALTDVFVMLEAVKAPEPRPLERRPDLAPLPERLEHADLLPPEQREQAGPPPQMERPTPVPLAQALAEARHLVLLGEPGAGKTTTLQFIALCFARGWAADRLRLDEPLVPVLLRLPDLAGHFAAPGPALEEALAPLAQALAGESAAAGYLAARLLGALGSAPAAAEVPGLRQRIASILSQALRAEGAGRDVYLMNQPGWGGSDEIEHKGTLAQALFDALVQVVGLPE